MSIYSAWICLQEIFLDDTPDTVAGGVSLDSDEVVCRFGWSSQVADHGLTEWRKKQFQETLFIMALVLPKKTQAQKKYVVNMIV